MVKRYCRSQKNCLFSGDFTHHWFHLRIQKVMWSMMMMLLSFYCSYTRITQFSNFYGKYVNLKAVKSSSLNHFFWMHNQKWVHEMAHRKPFQQMSGINYYMMELQWIIAQFDKEYHYCTTVLKDELQPHTHTQKKTMTYMEVLFQPLPLQVNRPSEKHEMLHCWAEHWKKWGKVT